MRFNHPALNEEESLFFIYLNSKLKMKYKDHK